MESFAGEKNSVLTNEQVQKHEAYKKSERGVRIVAPRIELDVNLKTYRQIFMVLLANTS